MNNLYIALVLNDFSIKIKLAYSKTGLSLNYLNSHFFFFAELKT